MVGKPLEADWKCFTKNIPKWRERYLTRKNKELVAILSDNNKSPTEQFWDANQLMKDEARILKSCLDQHSRSNMFMSLLLMFRYELIDETDLSLFSEELKGQIMAVNEI